jgi:hypothetical protein
MFGALPLSVLGTVGSASGHPVVPATPSQEMWDFRWVEGLKGKKHKAVFDCTEVESGYGVWRASIWENQYQGTLSAKPADIKTVLILRHNAFPLTLGQGFWDTYAVGKEMNVTHPVTLQATPKNPALLTSADNGVPQQFDAFALPNFMNRGGIVLACDLALQFFASGVAQRASISSEEAVRRVKAAMLPGIVLMPSGVFAAVRAQQEGCVYVKAS